MKIMISLSEEAKKELELTRRKRNSDIGQKAYYILLSNEGKSCPEIARQTGVNKHTVRKWLKAYIKGGIKALKSKLAPGRPNIKGKAIEDKIEEVVSKSPVEYGYLEEGWTANLLVDYFKRHGINVSKSTIKRILKKKGWRYKRFSKTVPENAPTEIEKKQRVQEIVSEIKENMKTHELEVLFTDESHFSNLPYVQRGWFRLGDKKK